MPPEYSGLHNFKRRRTSAYGPDTQGHVDEKAELVVDRSHIEKRGQMNYWICDAIEFIILVWQTSESPRNIAQPTGVVPRSGLFIYWWEN